VYGRAGVLVLALALIGGAGCASIDAAMTAHDRRKEAAAEKARLRRVDRLERALAAGDTAVMFDLAYAYVGARNIEDMNLPRTVRLLEGAAGQGNARAQTLLGEMLLSTDTRLRTAARFRSVAEERDRAMTLLKKAASQACVVEVNSERRGPFYMWLYLDNLLKKVEVGQRIVLHLNEQKGQEADTTLWHARDIVYCNRYDAFLLTRAFHSPRATDNRSAALGLILLTGDRDRIDSAKSKMTPQEIAAGEREAIELRRRVAASEAEYPAPKYKELP
jgi:TPR repeat protein